MKNVTYINAGAGSGKTYCLIQELIKLIKTQQAKPEEVILTTFTVKAANEFLEKAKAALFEIGMYDAAVQLDHALIGTVHSVCQRMIGKYWFHLGLSPNMGVMAEEDTRYYISQSLADLPSREELKQLHKLAEFFNIQKYQNHRPQGVNYNFWQESLKNIIDFATNYELSDFKTSKQKSLDYIRQFVDDNVNISINDDDLGNMLSEAQTYVQNSNRIRNKEKYFKEFEALQQTSRNKNTTWFKTVRDSFKAEYGTTCARVLGMLANMWQSQAIYEKQEIYINLLFDLAARWQDNFAQFKRDKNLLDYNDMEKYMRLLMQDNNIAQEIAQSFHYLFVDEFQDSSPMQVKIFDALSELMIHSYWVGDYKQAIYGFRGSDIALTKAVVDGITKKHNGCNTNTLTTSYRSLPDIVELNNAIFKQTFAGVLEEQNIRLEINRNNTANEQSLRYFIPRDGAGVAEHVLKLINQGVKPNEIAILARNNDTLNQVASDMAVWNIPTSRKDVRVTSSKTFTLVDALLRVIISPKDTLSKATIAILTEKDYSTQRIIEEKILNDADTASDPADYLSSLPLIKQLLTIRSRLEQQSVSTLLESMVIELNLYDVVKTMEQDSAFAVSCLQTIISTARNYEEHSVQMNMPATLDGFLEYIKEIAPVGSGDPDGVQLHTYHSSKGLQWKYVILMSLHDNVDDMDKIVNREIYGVHVIHEAEPSASNPYPNVYIRLTPWVYGSSTKVPNEIRTMIVASDDYRVAHKAMLAESNRLFYVGMTRPRDVLILDIDTHKRETPLQWPKDVGVKTIVDTIPNSGEWDIFGCGKSFIDLTLTEDERTNLHSYDMGDDTYYWALNIDQPTSQQREARYLSPSRVRHKGQIASSHNFNTRIPFTQQPSNMATVGDCIHHIFAGIEEKRPAYKIEMDEIIGSYGLSGVLTDKEAILLAWNNLTGFLTSTYGEVTTTYHERPFRLECNGQTIVGSIDLVWQTVEGDILIDFKTCPMGANAVLDTESDHFAGWYAGQLETYQKALEAAGEKVVKKYIYYPVNGMLVEVN